MILLVFLSVDTWLIRGWYLNHAVLETATFRVRDWISSLLTHEFSKINKKTEKRLTGAEKNRVQQTVGYENRPAVLDDGATADAIRRIADDDVRKGSGFLEMWWYEGVQHGHPHFSLYKKSERPQGHSDFLVREVI